MRGLHAPLDEPFAAMAVARCPTYDAMLIAVEREFRAVHREAVIEALDELAGPLFGLADAAPDERLIALARAAWAVHTAEHDSQLGAHVGADSPAESAPAGAMCAHQLAFAVLSGLASAWGSAGDRFRAQRASGLRLLLPLEEALRERVEQDVRAYGAKA